MISDRMKKMIEGSSVIRAMFEEGRVLAEKYGEENVYDFSLGNPSLPAPKELNEAILRIVKDRPSAELHGYMDNRGHHEVRVKIADKLNRTYQTQYEAENLIMTVGAAGGLNISLCALLNEGDEVITFSPYFSEYKHYVENFGGKLIVLPPNEKNALRPDSRALRDAVTKKTKAVIVNNPNNPTGILYTEAELLEIAAVLTEKEREFQTSIYLISDEPYRELVYDGLSVPFLPSLYKNTLLCYSFSKSLSLAGERIGYVLVPHAVSHAKDILAAAKIATRILGFVNAPSLIQLAVSACLDAKLDFSVYDENRKILYDYLTKLGFSVIKPEGAFYLFIKTPVDDGLFVQRAKEERILLVPASAFGSPNYVRLAYCVDTEKIKKSLPAFKKLAEFYNLIPSE